MATNIERLDRTDEEIRDVVGALLAGGANITATVDDAGETITIDTSALDPEQVRDEVASLLVGGNGIAVAVDDAADTVTLSVPTDAVGVDELDLSITPTWTGQHDFSAGITGLPSPSADSDAARKSYVDAIEQGLDLKDSVRAATAGTSIDLTSTTDPNPIDGVTLSDGDRVLLKDQATASENGIYVASTATDPTTWSRSPDADEDSEVTSGMFTFVEEGTTNLNRGFALATDGTITLGTTSLNFTQFSGAGQITAGTNLSKSGDTLNLVQGSGSGLDADQLDGSDSTAFVSAAGDTMSGPLNLNDNDLENVGATSEEEQVVSNAGTSYTVDLANGNVHQITLTSNCDISLSGVDTGAANSVTLLVQQDSTGGYTLSFTTTVLWPNGSKPSIATGANEITRMTFTYINGTWYGSKAGEAFA